MLLETKGLTKTFGGFAAVSNVDIAIREGEVRGIIGPNGSGKSTFFNLVTGVYSADAGSRITFDGREITDLETYEIARLGISRTFQLLRLFQEMTVLENVLVGHHKHVRYGMLASLIGTPRMWHQEHVLREEMMELLSFVGLADYANLPASELSGGQRRLLALARAMAMRPKMLLLDEPAAGLSPVNVDNFLNVVFALKERFGLTLVIIEHILKVVMESCDCVTVLEHGEKIAEGPPAAIKDDHRVIEAYLGKDMDDAEIRAFLDAA